MNHDDDHCQDLKPDAMDCLQRRHQQLAPGVYRCADPEHSVHLIGPELCRAAGVPITRRNIEILAEAALKHFEDAGLDIGGPLVVIE